MQAYQYINKMIPPLKLTDKVKMGLSWMEEIRTSILPVVDDGQFKGLITDEMLYDLNNPELTIGEVVLDSAGCYVFLEKHIYDVLKVSSEFHLTMVAVLDSENAYQGVVTIEDAITAFADTISIQTEGGVLILSMFMTDYSL